MLKSNENLDLDHCHHCGINAPTMKLQSSFVTNNRRQDAAREWCIHHCLDCGGAVLSGSIVGTGMISEIYPSAIKPKPVSEQHEVLVDLKAYAMQQQQRLASRKSSRKLEYLQ